ELDDCHYLGYLLVTEVTGEQYAQVRMIARIKSINEARPDIDNGKIYGRELVPMENVKKLLNYKDDAGNMMLDDAIEAANKKYTFEMID
ncbi:MAG: hypothetical protein K6F09_01045, partial [Clostridiales bacterium]|nr:hypothetical protein [Clostridiales bacterium]